MNVLPEMVEEIKEKLLEIEEQENIKIYYSCESGSRAWGFPSPDSDYDVRFIYTRPLDNYISLIPQPDQLTYPINDDLDIIGWDIIKVLKLMSKSNTTPFEWLQSPIHYRDEDHLREELWQLCPHYFSARGNAFHYVGIANSAIKTMNDDRIGIKKLFYVLRPLLSALWCVDRNSIAPMMIEPMLILLPDKLHHDVLQLIELKRTVNEGYLIELEPDLKKWIMETFDECTEKARLLDKKHFDISLADEYFKKIVTQ